MARETSANGVPAADRSPNEANGLGNQPAVPTSRPEGRRRTLLPGQPFEMMNQDFQSAMGKSTSGSHPTWNNAWLSEGETKTNRLRFLLIQTRRKLLLLHRAGRPAKPFRRRPDAALGRPTYIVGIGSSAGGLEAVEPLRESLPSDSGMAFVLIQHLDPHHPSALVEILSKATSMPVEEASDARPRAPIMWLSFRRMPT